MEKELSLYVHIPFCIRKCLYCDFLSFNAEKSAMKAYFEALGKEVSFYAGKCSDYKVRSVFFGGGTPSYPDPGFICDTLRRIRDEFNVAGNAEITIEVNPASAIKDRLREFYNSGFNRLSIGAQSLNDEELNRLGRPHDGKMFLETFSNARDAGFGNINVDIMSALPGQKLSSYLETVEQTVRLRPEHISAYSLIVEEGTPFSDMELDLPDEDEDRAMYHETKRILAENGYHRYEISNYALGDGETYECYHNKVYWRRGNYLGLGLGASSMLENVRWNNTKDMTDYLETSDSDVRENIEPLDERSCMEEFMFLGLRLVKGVSVREFEREFGRDIYSVYADVIEKYVASGHLERVQEEGGEYLRLTDAGLDVSNTVMAEFIFDRD